MAHLQQFRHFPCQILDLAVVLFTSRNYCTLLSNEDFLFIEVLFKLSINCASAILLIIHFSLLGLILKWKIVEFFVEGVDLLVTFKLVVVVLAIVWLLKRLIRQLRDDRVYCNIYFIFLVSPFCSHKLSVLRFKLSPWLVWGVLDWLLRPIDLGSRISISSSLVIPIYSWLCSARFFIIINFFIIFTSSPHCWFCTSLGCGFLDLIVGFSWCSWTSSLSLHRFSCLFIITILLNAFWLTLLNNWFFIFTFAFILINFFCDFCSINQFCKWLLECWWWIISPLSPRSLILSWFLCALILSLINLLFRHWFD